MKKMKLLIMIVLIISSANIQSQNQIDANNYYEYYSTGKNLKGKILKTRWLKKIEVSEIIEEEFKKAGFKWITTFRIIKIDSINYVNSICYSGKSNFGFLYETSHMARPKKENRKMVSIYKNQTGNDYYEKIYDINGESKFLKIKTLPNNLHLLKEDIYWYQQTEKQEDNSKLVTKEIIIEILRNDIKKVLENK